MAEEEAAGQLRGCTLIKYVSPPPDSLHLLDTPYAKADRVSQGKDPK